MRRLILFLAALAATAMCPQAKASCSLSILPGASQSQIQAGLNSCTSGSTATLPAGSYSINSGTLSIPCGVNFVGPAVPLAGYNPGDGYTRGGYLPTAKLVGSLARTAAVMTVPSGCSASQRIAFIECDGGAHGSLGGSCLYVPANAANVTVTENYLHGNQTVGTNCCGDQQHDAMIYLDGSNPGTNTQNVSITWNRFGATGDCSNIMNINGPPYKGTSPDGGGGECAAIGVHGGVTNLTVQNNSVYQQEQGFKMYEGSGNNSTSFCGNCNWSFNDWGTIHRIAFETQVNPSGSPEIVSYNSYHDDYQASYYSMGLSLANGLAAETDGIGNLLIGNVFSNWLAIGHELWGSHSIAKNEYFEGYWSAAIGANYLGNFTVTGNFFCGPGSKGQGSSPKMDYTDEAINPGSIVFSGNTPSAANSVNTSGQSTCSPITSTQPTISPAAGAQTYPLTVTLTNQGTSGQTNTSLWYTTDGSTPVPWQGSTKLYTAPFQLASAQTVKAIGNWGAPNQPSTWPAGYGFVPSAVLTAAYTGGGTRTVTSVTLATTNSATALHVGATNQASATCHYNDGSSDNCVASSHAVTWASGTPATATISSSGLITAVANGTTNLSATSASITSAAVPLTVSTLTSITIASAAGTSLHAAATSQFSATCVYASGFSNGCNTVDLFGYTAAWTSGTPATGTISSPGGLFTAVASGTTAVHASAGGVNSSNTTMTVIGATLSSIALATTGGVTSIVVGGTNQLIATGTFSDSTTATIVPTSWASSNPSTATVSATGLVTGVSASTTNLTATMGAVTSAPLALTVTTSTTSLSPGSPGLSTPGGVNSIGVGTTIQFSTVCSYTDGSSDDCTRLGGPTTWTTTNSAVMTISSGGLGDCIAVGTAGAQARVGINFSQGWFMNCTAGATLTTATAALFGGVTSIPTPALVQMIVTCVYSDGTSAVCSGPGDTHGNQAGTYASSNTGVATIDTNGVVTPVAAGSTILSAIVGTTNVTLGLTVTAPAGSLVLGQNQEDHSGATGFGFTNMVYAVTPATGGPFTIGNCHFFLAPGTLTSGKHWDCILTLATSGTTQATSALCHGTYTQSGSTSPNAFVSATPSGCPTLPNSTAYWIGVNSDDNEPSPPVGFYDCGGTCAGRLPTSGTGTYPYRFQALTYGAYTGMPTATSAGSIYQPSQYFDITSSAPTLASAFQTNTGSVHTVTLASASIQQRTMCVYTDAVQLDCTFGDARGSAVTAWSVAFSPLLTIGAVGSSTPGIVKPTNEGTTTTGCTVTGGISCIPYTWTITNVPLTGAVFPGMTLSGVKTH